MTNGERRTLNADDNAGGDNLNCGTGPFASDLAIFNLGDVVSTNCDLLQPA